MPATQSARLGLSRRLFSELFQVLLYAVTPHRLNERPAGRVTYVIGKDGKVKSIYDDLANATLHPEKALNAL